MSTGTARFPGGRAPLAEGDPEPRRSRDRRGDARADEPLPLQEDRDQPERREACDPDLGAEGSGRDRD
ncbi:MAG TPA: hypothetical protein VFW45_14010 [Candidatus Polarisedimenticolia bacterium]|nr:hypothetical protein [Candidatus Polarisedimenticolia bacterium]